MSVSLQRTFGYSGRFEARSLRSRLILLTLLGVLMTAASAGLTVSDSLRSQIWGWIGSIFFGACTIVGIVRSFRPPSTLVIDTEGIDDSRVGAGNVKWDDIKSVSIREVKSRPFICVELYDEQPYLAKLPAYRRALVSANHAIGFPMVCLNFTEMDRTIDDAMSVIRTIRPEKIAAN
jgi:hypothetical protein